MNLLRRLPIAGMAMLLPVLAAVAEAQQETNLKIIQRWKGNGSSPSEPGAQFEPYIVSFELLNTPYESWTSADQQLVPRSMYEQFLATATGISAAGRSGLCAEPEKSTFGQASILDAVPGTVTAIEYARSSPLAIFASLAKRVPAWDFLRERVVTIVALKVNQVIKNSNGDQLPKNIWVVADYGAATTTQGIVMCSKGPTSTREALSLGRNTTSQDYLVLGRLSINNPGLVDSPVGGVFRVVNSEIQYLPVYRAFPSQPMSLETFISGVSNQ